VDVPTQTYVYAGRPVSIGVTAGGTPPFTYQWQLNSVNISDDGRITGSHSSVLSIASAQTGDAGNYQVFVSNSAGGPISSSLGSLLVDTKPGFGNNGLGWLANGGASFTGDVLSLTDGAAGEARSSFYTFPLNIDAFIASFTYQDVGGGGADGAAFVLQNSTNGAAALGSGGGALGYGGAAAITPSVALELNIYGPNTVGIAFRTNGVTGAPYTDTSPVILSSGDPISVTLAYAQGQALLTMTNTTTLATYSAQLTTGDLPTLLGAHTAYVGITAADGQIASSQLVSNFSFISFPALSAQTTGGSLVLTWPASVGGFVLQQSASLSAPSWSPVVAPVSVVAGQNRVVLSPAGANEFYRLVLP
ncbi:MAG: hypothetical protein JWR69_1879, partial [Pedosphaera sp.]|nr:hypothetical protein [Pedosphaera sp.]